MIFRIARFNLPRSLQPDALAVHLHCRRLAGSYPVAILQETVEAVVMAMK
jgi:hypothetical protein